MVSIPSVQRNYGIGDTSLGLLIPQNSVQVYDTAARKFIPLSEAFDIQGTLEASAEDGSISPEIIKDILDGWEDWYRVPTVSAIKQLFPDTEVIQKDRTRHRVSNVVQERSDSPWFIRYRVRAWVSGRDNPVVMTLTFPALYRGTMHMIPTGSLRVWRDTVLSDGTILRSLGALILHDLAENKEMLMRRAEYLSDEQLQARWQQRIDRVANTLYSAPSADIDSGVESLSEYALEAIHHTIRIVQPEDVTTDPDETLPHANLVYTARRTASLMQAGEIADSLHTSSGSPCSMFYRPWAEHPEDGEPIQLWKHTISKMVNPARVGVLAGDIHCLPLAKGPLHRVQVKDFPYYQQVQTRDLLGVACDLQGVLGDGFIISETSAEELSVVISKWETLTIDGLINQRGKAQNSTQIRAKPIVLPIAGGEERRWRVCMEHRIRKVRVGDKLQSGIIKGVVNRILPDNEMPKVIGPDGIPQPAEIIFSWRHWQKWGALSELCRAQLAYWCATDDDPLIIEHGSISTPEEVQDLVSGAGGSPDLTLPVLFSGSIIQEMVYGGYFPVGVREQLVDIQSSESRIDAQKMLRAAADPLSDPVTSLLAEDRVSSKGVRLGYADVFCLLDECPETANELIRYSSDWKLTELAAVFMTDEN